MQLTIEEAIEWIYNWLLFGSRPGLDRINASLEKIYPLHTSSSPRD